MINLIPAKAKKALALEYWIRVLSVWLMVWSIALFIGTCVLLPSYVLIQSQVQVYEESFAAVQEKVADYESVSVELVRSSQQAKYIIDEDDLLPFSEYITLFESLQGVGVSLTNININRIGKETQVIALKGVAEDRYVLAEFRDRLLAESVVASVDLPISNLAADRDILFDISVTLTEDKESNV